MATVTALEQYRACLESVDQEVLTSESEYADLLTPGEVLDLLVVRDEIDESKLNPDQRRRLVELDDLLVKHARLVTDNAPPQADVPRSRWWWHLHKGPQVRDDALAATRARDRKRTA